MSQKLSTGLVDAIAGGSSLLAALAGTVIEIRSGVQPVNADAAATGTLLWEATLNGDGVTALTPEFDTPGIVKKPDAAVWSGKGLAAGTAGWYRVRKLVGDTGGVSVTAIRVDGSIGTDMTVNTTAVELNVPQLIVNFLLRISQG